MPNANPVSDLENSHYDVANSKRTAVHVRGLALLALSFQTLGTSPIFSCVHCFVAAHAVHLSIHSPAINRNSYCTGIIYSDIGTSPLYVLNGIWPADGPVPSEEDVIGGISAIIWALTILPLIKYVSILAFCFLLHPHKHSFQVFICLHFGTTEGNLTFLTNAQFHT